MSNGNQFYEKKLGAAYWYISHRLLIKQIISVILIAFNIFFISYLLFLLIFNLAIYNREYQDILNALVSNNPDYPVLRQVFLPKAIQLGQINIYASAKGSDIVLEIGNPNPKWWATFDYQFQVGADQTEIRKGYILPNERKKIVDLAVENGNLASQLILTNINWQKIINYENMRFERFKFDIQNIQYIPAKELGIEKEVPVSRAIFEVSNQGAYSFKDVNFLVFIYSSGQPVAVNQVVAEKILSGQTVTLEVTFFQNLPRIESIDIIPEVNILDEKSYIGV